MQSQTNAIAPEKRARRASNASSARKAVARSPYPIITRNSTGTPASTAPGARIVPPTVRNAWIHSNGTRAASRGRLDRRGATYQKAISAYATRLNVNWMPNRTIGSTSHSSSGSHAAVYPGHGDVFEHRNRESCDVVELVCYA